MKYLAFALLVLASVKGSAQVAYDAKEYARKPVWIEMIKDTAVNFFEAEKAFNTYFKHHEKPEGEAEDIGEHKKREKYPSKKEQREMQRENRMRMEVKRYEHWRDMIRPYVQADGSIPGPTKRLQIHRQVTGH